MKLAARMAAIMVLSTLIIYGLASFVVMEFDVTLWHIGARLLTVIFVVVALVLIVVAHSE